MTEEERDVQLRIAHKLAWNSNKEEEEMRHQNILCIMSNFIWALINYV